MNFPKVENACISVNIWNFETFEGSIFVNMCNTPKNSRYYDLGTVPTPWQCGDNISQIFDLKYTRTYTV